MQTCMGLDQSLNNKKGKRNKEKINNYYSNDYF